MITNSERQLEGSLTGAPSSRTLSGRPCQRQESRKLSSDIFRRHVTLLLMGLPAVLLLLVFAYIPMFGLVIAFKDYRAYLGIFGSAWVGLQNFQFLFGTPDAWRITYNTLSMNAIFIVTGLVGSLTLALCINEIRDSDSWLARFYQSALFFPYFLSYVIVSYFVYAVLNVDNGLLNRILAQFGLAAVDWYASPQYWVVILTLVNLWKSVGFGCVIYLAGIVAINPEYYEAARIDGASKWAQIRFITLPLLRPLIILTTLLAIGHIFYADFGLFFQVTRNSGLLYSTTDVIDTYVYRTLTTLGDVGMSSAAGFYQAIVGFILVVFSNWIVRRTDPDKALF